MTRTGRAVALCLVGVLGAYGGMGLSFTLTALRLETRGGGYQTDHSDDLVLWLLFTLFAVAGTVTVSAAVRARRATGAICALAGATSAAVLPFDYRGPGELSAAGHGVLLASPMVVMAALLLANRRRR